MVLKLFRGLLNMALKCERRKLSMTETPTPNSDPMVSKEMMGHDVYSTWIVVTLTTRHNCPVPNLLPGPCSNWGQAGPWRADCSSSPRLSRVSPPQQRILRSPVAGGQRLTMPWDLYPQGKPQRPQESGMTPGNGSFELTHRPFGSASCSAYPPQTSGNQLLPQL